MASWSRFHFSWGQVASGVVTVILMQGLAVGADSPEVQFQRGMKAYEEGTFYVAQARLQDAARGGHTQAHEMLAYMYLLGSELYPGVDQNRPLALKHLESATLGGSTQAAFTLCAISPHVRDLNATRKECPRRILQQVAAEKGALIASQVNLDRR